MACVTVLVAQLETAPNKWLDVNVVSGTALQIWNHKVNVQADITSNIISESSICDEIYHKVCTNMRCESCITRR